MLLMHQEGGWCPPPHYAEGLDARICTCLYFIGGATTVGISARAGSALLVLTGISEYTATLAAVALAADRPYWADPSLRQAACEGTWGGVSPGIVSLTAFLLYASCLSQKRPAIPSLVSLLVILRAGAAYTCFALLWPSSVALSCVLGCATGRLGLLLLDAPTLGLDAALAPLASAVLGTLMLLGGAVALAVSEGGSEGWSRLHAAQACAAGWGGVVGEPYLAAVARPAAVVAGAGHIAVRSGPTCPAGWCAPVYLHVRRTTFRHAAVLTGGTLGLSFCMAYFAQTLLALPLPAALLADVPRTTAATAQNLTGFLALSISWSVAGMYATDSALCSERRG